MISNFSLPGNPIRSFSSQTFKFIYYRGIEIITTAVTTAVITTAAVTTAVITIAFIAFIGIGIGIGIGLVFFYKACHCI